MRPSLVHVLLIGCVLWPGAVRADSELPAKLFLDGERLRHAGLFARALERCLTVWDMGDPWGLICAARTERRRADYKEARRYLAALERHITLFGSKNDNVYGALAYERETLDEIEGRLRWMDENKPDLTHIGALQSDGERVRAVLRLTNSSDEDLHVLRVEVIGFRDDPDLQWRTPDRVIAPGGSIVGDIEFSYADLETSAMIKVSGGIGDTGLPVKTEWRPIKMTWADPPDPRWKHLTVGIRASYGGFWVPDGRREYRGDLEPTSATGFALRVGKGFHEYLAVEGEIAGGSTGVATFEPGMTRRGRYGRVVLQGVARYGKDWIGSVRLGTGLQVAVYESSQADMAGTDIELLGALGFAFERRLGRMTIGLHGDYAEGLKSGASAVAIALQAGYGWSL